MRIEKSSISRYFSSYNMTLNVLASKLINEIQVGILKLYLHVLYSNIPKQCLKNLLW